jgi:hypothetical protein
MSMTWEWPYTLGFLDIIELHSSKIKSLTLKYHECMEWGHTPRPSAALSDFKWKSLKHICLKEWDFSASNTPWNVFSGLQLDRIVFEVYITHDVYGWSREQTTFEKIVTLIVHTGMISLCLVK